MLAVADDCFVLAINDSKKDEGGFSVAFIIRLYLLTLSKRKDVYWLVSETSPTKLSISTSVSHLPIMSISTGIGKEPKDI